jgi:hypothetical protein
MSEEDKKMLLRQRRREFGEMVMKFWRTHDGISLRDMSDYLSTGSMLQGEFWQDFSDFIESLEKQVEEEERVGTLRNIEQ